jgi:hypothetical protein
LSTPSKSIQLAQSAQSDGDMSVEWLNSDDERFDKSTQDFATFNSRNGQQRSQQPQKFAAQAGHLELLGH